MIYIYGLLTILNVCSGLVAAISGDKEMLRHAEIIIYLLGILITLETKKGG